MVSVSEARTNLSRIQTERQALISEKQQFQQQLRQAPGPATRLRARIENRTRRIERLRRQEQIATLALRREELKAQGASKQQIRAEGVSLSQESAFRRGQRDQSGGVGESISALSQAEAEGGGRSIREQSQASREQKSTLSGIFSPTTEEGFATERTLTPGRPTEERTFPTEVRRREPQQSSLPGSVEEQTFDIAGFSASREFAKKTEEALKQQTRKLRLSEQETNRGANVSFEEGTATEFSAGFLAKSLAQASNERDEELQESLLKQKELRKGNDRLDTISKNVGDFFGGNLDVFPDRGTPSKAIQTSGAVFTEVAEFFKSPAVGLLKVQAEGTREFQKILPEPIRVDLSESTLLKPSDPNPFKDPDIQAFGATAAFGALRFVPVVGKPLTTLGIAGFTGLQAVETIKEPTVQNITRTGLFATGLVGPIARLPKTIKTLAKGEFIPPEKVFDIKVLEGEQTFPTTPSIPAALKSFEQAPKVSTGKKGVASVTAANIPSNVRTRAGPQALAGLEDPGLFVTPKGRASPFFLRVGLEASEIKPQLTLIDFNLGRPQVLEIGVKGVKRQPQSVLLAKDFAKTEAFLETQAGKEFAFITKRSEARFDPRVKRTITRGGTTSEIEAVIPPGTELVEVPGSKFTRFKGELVPIREFKITGKSATQDFGRATKDITSALKSSSSFAASQRKVALRSVPTTSSRSLTARVSPRTVSEATRQVRTDARSLSVRAREARVDLRSVRVSDRPVETRGRGARVDPRSVSVRPRVVDVPVRPVTRVPDIVTRPGPRRVPVTDVPPPPIPKPPKVPSLLFDEPSRGLELAPVRRDFAPSLSGVAAGVELPRVPRGTFTGLEARGTVKRRRKSSGKKKKRKA